MLLLCVLTGLIGARAPVGHDVHAIRAGQAVVRVVGGGRVVGVHHGGGAALEHEPGRQSYAGHQGWQGGPHREGTLEVTWD